MKALRQRGIVHRDIKPANVLIDTKSTRRFIVSDLGIISLFWKNISDEERSIGALTDERLKAMEEMEMEKDDEFTGSPEFMAPELWVDGEAYSYAADVWSAALVGFFALVGRVSHSVDLRLLRIF